MKSLKKMLSILLVTSKCAKSTIVNEDAMICGHHMGHICFVNRILINPKTNLFLVLIKDKFVPIISLFCWKKWISANDVSFFKETKLNGSFVRCWRLSRFASTKANKMLNKIVLNGFGDLAAREKVRMRVVWKGERWVWLKEFRKNDIDWHYGLWNSNSFCLHNASNY